MPVSLKTLTEEEYLFPGRSGCPGCAGVLIARLVLKILGSETIMVSGTGCVLSNFTHAGGPKIPYMHSLFPGAGSLAAGIDAGLSALKRRKGIRLLVMAGDGGTADIGLQALSGAVERGHSFIYVCYDNEGYMNTGGQRSGTTPSGARTATTPVSAQQSSRLKRLGTRKNMVEIMAAHGIPYAATASPGFIQDLIRKVEKAGEIEGPAYLHVHTPCNYRWGFGEDESIRVARMAVETRVFPLVEIENGRDYFLARKNRPQHPVHEYLSLQRRYGHLNIEDVEELQSEVDRTWKQLRDLADLTSQRRNGRVDD